MRTELATAVSNVLGAVDTTTPPRDLTDDEIDRLVNLSAFVVGARTAVERDGYDREVVVMPSTEAPGRLVGELGQFLAGIEAVGADTATAWRIVDKVGWDCVPDMRRRVLHALHAQHGQRVSDLATATDIPRTSVERCVEDLVLLGLVDRRKDGAHDTAAWRLDLAAHVRQDWP